MDVLFVVGKDQIAVCARCGDEYAAFRIRYRSEPRDEFTCFDHALEALKHDVYLEQLFSEGTVRKIYGGAKEEKA